MSWHTLTMTTMEWVNSRVHILMRNYICIDDENANAKIWIWISVNHVLASKFQPLNGNSPSSSIQLLLRPSDERMLSIAKYVNLLCALCFVCLLLLLVNFMFSFTHLYCWRKAEKKNHRRGKNHNANLIAKATDSGQRTASDVKEYRVPTMSCLLFQVFFLPNDYGWEVMKR